MTSRDRNRKEPLYLFMMLDSASRRVTLTYPGSTLEGESISPSIYVGEIGRHYGSAVGAVYDRPGAHRPPLQPIGQGEWLSAVAEEWRGGGDTQQRAQKVFGGEKFRQAETETRGTGPGPHRREGFADG